MLLNIYLQFFIVHLQFIGTLRFQKRTSKMLKYFIFYISLFFKVLLHFRLFAHLTVDFESQFCIRIRIRCLLLPFPP